MPDFNRLLEEQIPRLRRYARALTRNIERADDLVQDTLVRALAKQHLWQAGTNLRAFPVAQQWQNGALVVVAPETVKTGDATLVPLPAWDKR